MKANLNWTSGMAFNASSDGNQITIDSKAPLGKSSGMTPKELVAVGMGGCTAMDVVALLKKHKQTYDSFSVEVNVEPTTGQYPMVFKDVEIVFSVEGNLDKNILNESVTLSQTKYCGVNAMLVKAVPIKYKVILNGEVIGTGEAKFS